MLITGQDVTYDVGLDYVLIQVRVKTNWEVYKYKVKKIRNFLKSSKYIFFGVFFVSTDYPNLT